MLADVHPTAIVEHGRGLGRRRVGRPLFASSSARVAARRRRQGPQPRRRRRRHHDRRRHARSSPSPASACRRRTENITARRAVWRSAATARSASTSPSIRERRAAGCSPASATTACSSSARMSRMTASSATTSPWSTTRRSAAIAASATTRSSAASPPCTSSCASAKAASSAACRAWRTTSSRSARRSATAPSLGGLNIVGLTRRGFSREAIHRLRRAYRTLFGPEGTLKERLADVEEEFAGDENVRKIVAVHPRRRRPGDLHAAGAGRRRLTGAHDRRPRPDGPVAILAGGGDAAARSSPRPARRHGRRPVVFAIAGEAEPQASFATAPDPRRPLGRARPLFRSCSKTSGCRRGGLHRLDLPAPRLRHARAGSRRREAHPAHPAADAERRRQPARRRCRDLRGARHRRWSARSTSRPTLPLAGGWQTERVMHEARGDIDDGLRARRARSGASTSARRAVAVGGRVVAVEDAGGTDALLDRVAALRDAGRIPEAGGVLVKCMKPQQDRRLDVPTIGPQNRRDGARRRPRRRRRRGRPRAPGRPRARRSRHSGGPGSSCSA